MGDLDPDYYSLKVNEPLLGDLDPDKQNPRLGSLFWGDLDLDSYSSMSPFWVIDPRKTQIVLLLI